MINYVIFDMDGTLIDSMPNYNEAWANVADDWGLGEDFKAIYYPKVTGTTFESTKLLLNELYGKDFESDRFIDEWKIEIAKVFANGVKAKPGASELLKLLKEQGIKTAIATSTPLEPALEYLKSAGIDACSFDKIVAAGVVKRSKPAPDIFIEAGKQIGADPKETIVVEDASFGVIGAHAAGMRPVMVVDILPPTPEAKEKCFAVYDSLYEVIGLVKKENEIKISYINHRKE